MTSESKIALTVVSLATVAGVVFWFWDELVGDRIAQAQSQLDAAARSAADAAAAELEAKTRAALAAAQADAAGKAAEIAAQARETIVDQVKDALAAAQAGAAGEAAKSGDSWFDENFPAGAVLA